MRGHNRKVGGEVASGAFAYEVKAAAPAESKNRAYPGVLANSIVRFDDEGTQHVGDMHRRGGGRGC